MKVTDFYNVESMPGVYITQVLASGKLHFYYFKMFIIIYIIILLVYIIMIVYSIYYIYISILV